MGNEIQSSSNNSIGNSGDSAIENGHEFRAGGDVPARCRYRMTSFQAAELLGKCHPGVMWTLRKLLPKLPKTFRESHFERFETVQRSAFNRKKKVSAYYLSKTGCELLASMCLRRRCDRKREEITRAFAERFQAMEREREREQEREAVVIVALVTV